jgi:hypothetical protein
MNERGAFTTAKGGGFVLKLGREERALVARLLDELAALLADPLDPALTARLFPVVHPHRADQEAEYQRLMREELVASRLAGIETVKQVLGGSGSSGTGKPGSSKQVTFTEDQLVTFMQALNSVRLVLGTMLDVTEDDDERPGHELVPEYQLYAFLSWVLDSAVHALTRG